MSDTKGATTIMVRVVELPDDNPEREATEVGPSARWFELPGAIEADVVSKLIEAGFVERGPPNPTRHG